LTHASTLRDNPPFLSGFFIGDLRLNPVSGPTGRLRTPETGTNWSLFQRTGTEACPYGRLHLYRHRELLLRLFPRSRLFRSSSKSQIFCQNFCQNFHPGIMIMLYFIHEISGWFS